MLPSLVSVAANRKEILLPAVSMTSGGHRLRATFSTVAQPDAAMLLIRMPDAGAGSAPRMEHSLLDTFPCGFGEALGAVNRRSRTR